MQVDDKVKLAISLCNRDAGKLYQFNYLYPFTTENISAYIDMFDLKDKSSLVVGSSCDQVFNAILRNSKNITLCDVCPFTREYFYLKVALIKLLNREQYLKFLCYNDYPIIFFKNKWVFDKSVFDTIYPYLNIIDSEVAYFWEQLFKKINGSEIRKKLFVSDECSYKELNIMNRYLRSDDAFNTLSDKIDDVNIEFLLGDIFDVSINKKYDNIFLSNIATYYKLDKFKTLFLKLNNNLNDNGSMLVSYLYDTDVNIFSNNSIYNLNQVRRVLSDKLTLSSFVGSRGLFVNSCDFKDSVIIYKKVKKI